MKNPNKKILECLKSQGIIVASALTIKEIETAESFYGIKFHQDHKDFLQCGLPLGDNWYDWRNYSSDNTQKIKKIIAWPLEGILYDIEENNYWCEDVGRKPKDLILAKKLFTEWFIENVPQLVPIYSHRYVCNVSNEKNAPVYSVHQTDVILYGSNISEYLAKEFQLNIEIKHQTRPKDDISFWSKLAS